MEQVNEITRIIALTMDKNGVPQDVDTRVEIAAQILSRAMELGFDPQRLFIDTIVLPVKVPNAQGQPGNILKALDHFFPQNAQLHFCKAIAHTTMHAKTKRQVVANIFPVDNKLVGVFNFALITIT